ncbi:MAG: cytochrome C [Gammaproteobacteria bacterium]|nr:MAG: cytochrome C [Gammaproteobacteria bacterium]
MLSTGRAAARAALIALSGLLWVGALATPPPSSLRGADAACVNCHRRSGLGSIEGHIAIPPIAGPYLFVPRGERLAELGIPFVDTARINHDPYTDESLARAIRGGIGANGKTLNYLMPRYQIDDATMAELIGYLKGLRVSPSPGVSTSVLHFATIITPDADPVKRRGMLAVMNQYFVDKNNAVARTKAPTLYSSHTTMFRVERRWQLHVWELTGAPATWEAQLRKHLAAEPVFAVISGLGGSHWGPVQRFCEEQSLPCLFPNVEAPTGHDSDFYSVYFSRGVLLEAQLIARELADAAEPANRVVQVFRAGDVGVQAARDLQAARAHSGQQIVNRVLPAHATSKDLGAALRDVDAADALVLWLRPGDLSALEKVSPPTSRVWISGEMGGLEQAPLPASWRAAARMAYPVDLPGRRVVRVDYALSWFRIRKIPLLAQQVQADTYLACGLVSETLNHMVDAFVREYLIERVEMALDHRALTGYYPRLTLAPGQRFASKGGYIVRFSDPQGPRIAALGDWITP